MALAKQKELFWGLLRKARDLKVRPVAFMYMRAYDETPRVLRNLAMLNSGETEQTPETAKLMSGRLEFAMVLESLKGHAGHAPSVAAQSFADSSDTSAEASRTCIIHGTLGTPLSSLANQTGPVVAECIETCFELPRECERLVASTFPFTAQLRCTDMHRSYPCAERTALALRSRRLEEDKSQTVSIHSSTYFRCSMHRVRTAEKLVEDLDQDVESFMMNFTLLIRNTDFLRTLRR
jgi:hypothetical protein